MHPKLFDKILHDCNPEAIVYRYHHRLARRDGIYWRGQYICAVPNARMFMEEQKDYVAMFGVPYEALPHIVNILARRRVIEDRDKWRFLTPHRYGYHETSY